MFVVCFDLTLDWRGNLDVCGHTCGCLTAYCLASEICSEFSRLQGWWFEPCETFKASELNKKISRRAPEWYIGTYPSSFCLLSWSLLRLAPALANSDWITPRVNHMPLKNGAFAIGICWKGKRKRNVVRWNLQPESRNLFMNTSFSAFLYLKFLQEKWDGAVPLDLLMCAAHSDRMCPFFPLDFITSKRHLTILSVHGGDAIELKATFYLMYKLKNKKEKEKNTLIEDGNSSCSNGDKPWLLFPVYRMSRLWWGKNAVSLVLPDNWSCFVLIELLFFSVAEIAASGSVGL